MDGLEYKQHYNTLLAYNYSSAQSINSDSSKRRAECSTYLSR